MVQHWWGINASAFGRGGPTAKIVMKTGFKIGFVGRFVAEKGVLDLVDALALLDEEFGLVLIGDGPLQFEIERRVSKTGLVDRVLIVPPQNQRRLAEYYRALDLVVLPSRTTSHWKEQFGRVLVEAMFCGTPVAGSDSGAIPFVIDRSDMLFAENDPAAMAEVIRRARRNPTSQAFLEERVRNCDADDFACAWLGLAAFGDGSFA